MEDVARFALPASGGEMKSLGKRAEGARLERMAASPLWRDGVFRNAHPIQPGLRDPSASMPSV
jgi:hypothetical protein